MRQIGVGSFASACLVAAAALAPAPAAAREVVAFRDSYQAGTIVVKTGERRLYLVLGNGQAVRYPVGVGCSATAPLSACAQVEELVSNAFEVLDGGCVATGCSGQLCAEEPVATTCEWRPEYACCRDARCGRFAAGGRCGWESTPELAACLEQSGASLSPR